MYVEGEKVNVEMCEKEKSRSNLHLTHLHLQHIYLTKNAKYVASIRFIRPLMNRTGETQKVGDPRR